MADIDVVKISSLPLATSISDSDTLLAIQNGYAKRVLPSLMKGAKGDTGKGISSIAKTNTSGLTDTYTITYTDNTTKTYTIVNGDKGDAGKTPVLEAIIAVESGLNPSGSIVQDGVDETGNPKYKFSFILPKGDKGNPGDAGKGISNIAKTGTEGLVDTYTITYTDATTSTFTVSNGAAGSIGSGDAKDLTVTFTEAATRANISTGETIAVLFSKIKKWFTDLATVLSDYVTASGLSEAISTHNTSDVAHQDIRSSLSAIDAIARGKSRARIFTTLAELDTWLANSENTALLQAGDNLYIKALDVPDYWWDGTQRQILESEKVDLTEYLKSTDASTTYIAKVTGLTAHTSGLYKITVNADGLVIAVSAVAKEDITNLGIPAQDTTYSPATTSVNGLMSAVDKARMEFNYGSNSVNTLANLPVTKNLVVATLSAATILSVAAGLEINQSIHVCATASAAFTQTIPNTGSYVAMNGTSFNITNGAHFEIDIKCVSSGVYWIMVSVQS